MTVRRSIAAILLVAGLGLGAGCGGTNNVFTAETDDPYYREGQRLVRQGREAEALSAFLKVIEKRGEQASAESHLEAGLICLNHIKDPIEAIHHFRKYLELQPNAKQANGVRSLVDTAKREFARTLPAHPLESQPVSADQTDLVRQLQRENDDLRAELSAQRTANATQLLRSSRATVDVADNPTPPIRGPDIPLLTPAPMRGSPDNSATPTLVPTTTAASLFAPARPQTKSGRGGGTLSPAPSGRTHTVAPSETLFSISRKYGVTVEALQAANQTIVPTVKSPLPRGAELKIP